MNHSVNRAYELLAACEQILNHMEVNLSQENLLFKIKQQVNEDKRQLQYANGSSEVVRDVQQNVYEISNWIEQLQGAVLYDYQQFTNNSIKMYEALPYEQQLEQTESYHAKIDYYSTMKLLQNLQKVNTELRKIGS